MEKNAANAARNASNAARSASNTARSASNAARNAALRNAEDARQEQEAARVAREEAARVAREEAKQRETALQVSLQDAIARSEAAALEAQQSTSATQAQREQEAATAAAEQARIQTALDAATSLREQREQEHQEAIAAAKKETETARQTVSLLQSQLNRDNEAQQARIAQLEREIQEHNAAAEAKLAQLQQERNATLQERNAAEMRAAAELSATHEQALREKNAAMAAMEANRNERISAAKANARQARLERNAAQKEAREERDRLLAQHQNDLAAAAATRQTLSEQHAAALAAGDKAHAEQLRQQQKEAEAAHQQALHNVMVEAGEALKGHVAAIAAEKKKQDDSFQREKAEWASRMEEVENNNLHLTSESRAAKNQAAAAEREKTEAIDAAKAAAAASIAAAEAARQAVETTSAASRTNRATALTAQREAEAAAQEAREARVEAEEKAAAAAAREAEAQETARVAQEASQKALAEAEAARTKQTELEGQQATLKQATQALQDQLAAAEEAQQAAHKKIEEVEQARVANAANAATRTAAQNAAYEAEKTRLDAAVTAALAKAAAEKERADELQTTLHAQSAEYEAAAAEATITLESAVAQAAAEKAELEARHAAKMQETLQKIRESEARVGEIQADMEKTHAAAQVARSEQNSAHEAALKAQMVRLEENHRAAMARVEEEKNVATRLLERTIASHKETMARLAAVAMETQQAIENYKPIIETHERQIAELEKRHHSEMALLQKTTNQSIKNLVAMNEPLLLAAKEEAVREKQRAEHAIQEKTSQLAETTHQIEELTAQNRDLQRQLQQLEQVASTSRIINLRGVPAPTLSVQPVTTEAVNELSDRLTHTYFLPWRELLRQPAAIRADDMKEDDAELHGCLQRNPFVTLFSPLPEEDMMRTLLGEGMYREYTGHLRDIPSESATASSESSAASSQSATAATAAVSESATAFSEVSGSSGGGGKGMRIDIFLYYLIAGLRHEGLSNQSPYIDIINQTVASIMSFTEAHFERNEQSLVTLRATPCSDRLVSRHNKDSPLLTFLYLSSKKPFIGNPRFSYTIDTSNQSLTMTYNSTPASLYDDRGKVINHMVKQNQTTYRYGPFTKIYPPTVNSQGISNDEVFVDAVENRLRARKAVTVIGYGASGSGKTTTLVYAKHTNPPTPGLLALVANKLTKRTEKGHGFTSCKVVIYELDASESSDESSESRNGQCRAFSSTSDNTLHRTVLDKNGHATRHEIRYTDCKNAHEFSYKPAPNGWIGSSTETPLATEIVEYIDTKRNTAPTPNNPQSSRSHVICVLTFSDEAATAISANASSANASQADNSAVFIVCDFAGVENTFMCDDRDKQIIGDKRLVDAKVKSIEDGVKEMMTTHAGPLIQSYYDSFNKDLLQKALDKEDKYLTLSDKNIRERYRIFQDQQAVLQNPSKDIAKTTFVLNDIHRSNIQFFSYLLVSPEQSVIDTFIAMETACKEMYSAINELYRTIKKAHPDIEYPSRIFNYEEITYTPYGKHTGLTMDTLVRYKPAYDRILDLYRAHVRLLSSGLDAPSSGYELDVFTLTKILVWYTNSPVRFQLLFQSLMTRAYNSNAKVIMTKSEMSGYLTVAMCKQRVKEGVFINDSLARLRVFISASIRMKRSEQTRTPPFMNECIPFQCSPHHLHCFGQGVGDGGDGGNGGPLIKLIQKHTLQKENTFCIFTVVNLSQDANNPPPTPYIDITPLLTIREAFRPLLPGTSQDAPYKKENMEHALNEVRDTMIKMGMKDSSLNQEFEEYRGHILSGHDVPYYLEELLQTLIKHNAITTMGTIEFTDTMAKYGATQITCTMPSDKMKRVIESEYKGQVGQSVNRLVTQFDQTSTQAKTQAKTQERPKVSLLRSPQQPISTGYINLSGNAPENESANQSAHAKKLGGRMPTRVRRKANRRTRKKRNA